jgi:hypothetical protein
MLKISAITDEQRAYATASLAPVASSFSPYSGVLSATAPFPSGDLVVSALYRACMPFHVFNVGYLIGSRPLSHSQTTEIAGGIPDTYRYDERSDFELFSSGFYAFTRLLGGLGYSSAVTETGEHNVIHFSYRGESDYLPTSELSDGFSVVSSGGPTILGVPFPHFQTGIGAYGIVFGDSASTASSWDLGTPLIDALSCLETIKTWVESHTGGWLYQTTVEGRLADFRITDISFGLTGHRLFVTYTHELKLWNKSYPRSSSYWVKRTQVRDIIIDLKSDNGQTFDLSPISGVEYEVINPVYTIERWMHTATLTKGSGIPYIIPEWYASGQLAIDTVLTDSSFLASAISNGPADVVLNFEKTTWRPTSLPRVGGRPYWGGLLRTWAEFVSQDFDNLVAATFYSTADGLRRHVNLLQNNYLEDLSELGELGKLLPTLAPIARLYKDIKSMNLINAGVSFLDVLTGTKLWYEYGLKNSARSVEELATKFDATVSKLSSAGYWGYNDVYGKFSFELPAGRYGCSTPHLLSHTRSTVSFDGSMLLTAILGSNALGLAPNLSNAWDLVPFSFVADWFFNIGGRLEDIDTRGLMFLLPHVVSVHSIRIVDEFPDSLLEALDLSTTEPHGSGEYPSFRFYRRIISKWLAPLRISEYDFRSASGITDVPTAGSLVYQIIRSL